MSRKHIILPTIGLTAMFFVVGWFSYNWVLHVVTAEIEQHIVVTSVQETLNHRLMISLSLALVGVVIGVGTLLSGRFSRRHRYEYTFGILLVVAVFAVSGWIGVLTKKIAVLHGQTTGIPSLPESSLLLSEIHLYEIGLFGSACVLLMAIVLTIFPIK
jgi:hypothetical protein